MIKQFILLLTILACNASKNNAAETQATPVATQPTSIYQFAVNDIDGAPLDWNKFKGKKILVVNTASKCGFTPQYKELEALYQQYGNKVTVLGFPANNFAGQEPGSNEDIKQFCSTNYNVTFPMASKISVKGSDIAPVYSWLTQKSQNGVLDAEVGWNFNKFLLDEEGRLIAWFPSKVKPLDNEIVSKL